MGTKKDEELAGLWGWWSGKSEMVFAREAHSHGNWGRGAAALTRETQPVANSSIQPPAGSVEFLPSPAAHTSLRASLAPWGSWGHKWMGT